MRRGKKTKETEGREYAPKEDFDRLLDDDGGCESAVMDS